MVVCCLLAADSHFLHAETIGLKEAKSMARKFFNEAKGYVTPPVDYVYNGKDLTTHRLFTPFYVFNSPTGGFVVISAENKAFPILGFSLNSDFRKDKMADMSKEVLKDFSRDIELIRYDSRIPSEAIEEWRAYPEVVFNILKGNENGNYYHASLYDSESNWMVRKRAVEFDYDDGVPLDAAEYGETEVVRIERPAPPEISFNGSGHLSFSLPQGIDRILVFDVAGKEVAHKSFKGNTSAYIDLAANPNGFYIALVIDKNGISHSAKIYR